MGNSSSTAAKHPEGKTMKAVVFPKYGNPSVLTSQDDIPLPHSFRDDDVLIRVHAASINPVDKILMSGGLKLVKPVSGFPHVICYDAAGVVEQADKGGKFQNGDEVFVRLFGPRGENAEEKTPYYRGACAEYCVAQAQYCCKKPANISFEEAAAVPLAGMTAYQVLSLGLTEGKSTDSRVFISGGAGGVGTMAIQLAKHVFGAAFVVTTASPGEKTDLCRSLGADEVVDYRSQKFEELYAGDKGQFDFCFDCTGESIKMTKIVKSGGKIVTIHGNPTIESIASIGGSGCILSLVLKKRIKRAEYAAAKAVGADWEHLFLSPSEADLAALGGHLEAGTIKPVIDGVWKLSNEEWRGAFDKAFSGRAKGKCIVKCIE